MTACSVSVPVSYMVLHIFFHYLLSTSTHRKRDIGFLCIFSMEYMLNWFSRSQNSARTTQFLFFK
uniref:Uncharacterized protein n=1 Tax=Anguilla anguilla TaxID=7936 RepID=A0A0E9SCY3_ANGAN